MVTLAEYKASPAEIVRLPDDEKFSSRAIELCKLCIDFQHTAPRFVIVCTKDFYAGQGVHWSAGNVYETHYAKEDAEAMLPLINDAWSGFAWSVEERTPLNEDRE